MKKGEQAKISPMQFPLHSCKVKRRSRGEYRSVVGRLIQPRAPHKNMYFWSTGLQHVYR